MPPLGSGPSIALQAGDGLADGSPKVFQQKRGRLPASRTRSQTGYAGARSARRRVAATPTTRSMGSRPGTAGRGRPGPAPGGRVQASARVRRRRTTTVFFFAVVAALGVVAINLSGGSAAPPLTHFRARIVSAAESQIGYKTDPSRTYCNKFSAYWQAGTSCTNGLRSEEWCADFAAWAWRQAAAQFVYAYTSGDINAAAFSFYQWAVLHHTWHPVGSGYTPRPGDVAVYGLDTATDTAVHVAVVTGYTPGTRGPNVVNGDGDRTGFSVVEAGTDQYKADAPGGAAPISGYASPIPPPKTAGSSSPT